MTQIVSRGPGRPVFEQLETRTLFDGQLDTGWASGGVAIGINPGATNVGSVDVLLNGNLVATGPSGATVFGPAGNVISTATFGPSQFRLAQPDGRYIVANDFGLSQYAADGTLIRQFSGGQLAPVGSGRESRYRDLALAPNGDILLAGQVGTALFGADEAVVEFNGVEIWSPDGQLKGTIQLGNFLQNLQVAAQPDGRILVALGQQLSRYLPSGELDPTFGTGGKATINYDSTAQQDLATDQFGRIYVSYSRATGNSFISRYDANTGGGDGSFGSGGTVNTSNLALNGTSASLGNEKFFVAPEGSVYVAAMSDAGADDHLAVVRLKTNGAKDTTWGTGGRAVADVTDGDRQGGQVRDFAVMPDGDVVVAVFNGGSQSALARFQSTSNGTPPAATPVQLIGDRLYVTGTSGSDIIRFESNNIFGINVTINGQLHTFEELTVREILVLAGDGNDYVEARDLTQLPDVAGVDYEMIIDGGDGNDVIVGHQGRDRIRGENGADRLHGWSGADWVSGNAQQDRVLGGSGDDILNGNGGRDRVVGEDGNDTVIGGDQPDTLFGMDGDDSLLGEGGHDRLEGGAGIDFLSGGGGDDTFYVRDGFIDRIVGGKAGLDRAQADEDDVIVAIEELLA